MRDVSRRSELAERKTSDAIEERSLDAVAIGKAIDSKNETSKRVPLA